jgi:hypothetical protein
MLDHTVRTNPPLPSLEFGSAGLTCELGPRARSVADVQSHEDEGDQGQHRYSHGGRERLCAE